MCRNCYVLIPSPPAFCGPVADKTKQRGEKSHHGDSPGILPLPFCLAASRRMTCPRPVSCVAFSCVASPPSCPPTCQCFLLILRTLPVPHGKAAWRRTGCYRACTSFQNGHILHREALWKESKALLLRTPLKPSPPRPFPTPFLQKVLLASNLIKGL